MWYFYNLIGGISKFNEMYLLIHEEWFVRQPNRSQINQKHLPLKILSQIEYGNTFLWILDTNNNLIDDGKAIFVHSPFFFLFF